MPHFSYHRWNIFAIIHIRILYSISTITYLFLLVWFTKDIVSSSMVANGRLIFVWHGCSARPVNVFKWLAVGCVMTVWKAHRRTHMFYTWLSVRYFWGVTETDIRCGWSYFQIEQNLQNSLFINGARYNQSHFQIEQNLQNIVLYATQ